jgi:hypothetical protein
MYEINLKSIEEINGQKCYRIDVKLPNGREISEFYDQKTALKLREMTTEGEGTEATTIITDFSDYREVGGVKFAHKSVVTGMMPTPVEFLVKEIKVNHAVSDELFKL